LVLALLLQIGGILHEKLWSLLAASLALLSVQAPFAAVANEPLPSVIKPDYQLGGTYKPPTDVNVVIRDSTEMPAPGIYSICYINGFQSQPGILWPKELLLRNAKGAPIADPDWPDEYFLDISTEAKRSAILDRLAPDIRSCAKKGFRAVEFDNLDSYSRTGGRLKLSHAVAFAKMLVATTKSVGMVAGQKNAVEMGQRGRDDIGFSFVVTEECHRWNECGEYTKVYGNQIINIEYVDDLRGTFEKVCADPQTPKSTILRDRLLAPQGRAEYVYGHC
jgi:hypothetical protein